MGFEITPKDQIQSFSRRALIVGGAQLGVFGVLGGRLAWLQIIEGKKYETLSDKNRINLKLLAPSRGEIVDCYGEALALNQPNYRVLIIPEQITDLKESLAKLQNYITVDQRNIDDVLKRAKKQARFVPLEVQDKLTWEDVAKIEVHLPDLPGVSIDVGEIRHYPNKDATSHIVGYVGAVTKEDLKEDDPVLKLPGFKIGKTGLEKARDEVLRGRAGTAQIEVNVRGREVRELDRQHSVQGAQLALSIDAGLQNFVQQRLGQEKSASAVIMDAKNGAVYALSSSPGFNPNSLTRGIAADEWEALLANPGYPLNNKAISGQYPPGSTFKMITALAALEEGVINKNTRFHCPGHFEFGGDRFHCWKWSGHGRMNVVQALSQSCDVFFYEVATRLGIDKIAEYARKFGLGEKLDFILPEERAGLMPDQAWKMGHLGESWKKGETVVASIGQGYIQSTPLQLATMTARLVNGGYDVKPWLVGTMNGKYEGSDKHESQKRLIFNPDHLELIKRGMNFAVNDEKGTARSSAIEDKLYAYGGKTGTSQVRRITMEERINGIKNEELPWRLRHHALFVGYAPLVNPRYVCSVVVEHGGSGSGAAAPVARDILLEVQKRDPAKAPLFRHVGHSASIIRPVAKPQKAREL